MSKVQVTVEFEVDERIDGTQDYPLPSGSEVEYARKATEDALRDVGLTIGDSSDWNHRWLRVEKVSA